MSIPIGRYLFEGPFEDPGKLENKSGVYAVSGLKMYADSGQNQPYSRWEVIDVGESADVRTRVENHERSDCWQSQGCKILSYAAHYCDQPSRERIEKELRQQLNPPCGQR